MACGCTSACGCSVVGDGVTAEVTRAGDEFTVSAIGAIMGVANTDCIALDIDEDKVLTATIIPSVEPGSVELTCTEDGLTATVVPDPSSSAIVSVGPDGLRVDVPPPAEGSIAPQPGDLIFHMGIGFRAGAIDADGEEVSRASYPALHDALSLKATDAVRSAGLATITGIGSTRFIEPGMAIEATGFGGGATVVSVDTSSSITVSTPSVDSGLDTEVRVYPHGNGDGVLTFNTPSMNKRFPRGFDYDLADEELGSQGGGTAVLDATNLPAHTHPATVNDPGHGHTAGSTDSGHTHSLTIASDGDHTHAPGNPASQFVTVLDTAGDPFTGADYIAFDSDGAGDTSLPTQPGSGGFTYAQGNRGATTSDGAHDHAGSGADSGVAAITTTVDANDTGITVDVEENTGTAEPVEVNPAYTVGRWMVIV